jgi:hypothetical protein
MSLPGLAIALMLAFVVVLWIGLPLLRREEPNNTDVVDARNRQQERLTLYYSRVLRNIHDLDEDFATGKLDEAEYQQEREAWTQRGVAALQALDTLTQKNPPPQISTEAHAAEVNNSPMTFDDTGLDDAALDASIEAAIEAAVRKQRAQL